MSEHNEFGQPVGATLPHWRAPPVPPRASIVGRWCTLEPLATQRHAHTLFAQNTRDDGRMWTYLPYGPFVTLEAYRAWLDSVVDGADPLFFAIVVEGRPLGIASYLRIDPRIGSVEVGHLAYSPALQRSRAGTEAMYLMMRNAFELGYRRYEWKCNALNVPSRAAALRLGFTFEGVFRQAGVVKGRSRDTAWYAIIDAEWPALRAAYDRWLATDNFTPSGEQRTRLSDLTIPALRRQ